MNCGRTGAREGGWFELSEFALDRSYRLPRHRHARPSIAVLLEGTLDLLHGSGDEVRLDAGSVVLIPADEAHEERVPGPDVRCLLVSYDHPPETSKARFPDGLARLDPGVVSALPRLIADALRQDDDLGLDAVLHELTTAAGVEAARSAASPGPSGAPGWLPRIREMLDDGHRGPPSLAELAAEAGVTREHLARAFRHRTGLTVGQYVRRRRVLEGAHRLRGTRLPLPDIAFALGYADQSHFTRQFRAQLGVTPGQYRRLCAS